MLRRSIEMLPRVASGLGISNKELRASIEDSHASISQGRFKMTQHVWASHCVLLLCGVPLGLTPAWNSHVAWSLGGLDDGSVPSFGLHFSFKRPDSDDSC